MREFNLNYDTFNFLRLRLSWEILLSSTSVILSLDFTEEGFDCSPKRFDTSSIRWFKCAVIVTFCFSEKIGAHICLLFACSCRGLGGGGGGEYTAHFYTCFHANWGKVRVRPLRCESIILGNYFGETIGLVGDAHASDASFERALLHIATTTPINSRGTK